jgi:hypothetical protein
MKPIVFTDANMFVATVDKIAAMPIWDDWWKARLAQIAPQCLYFSVESVKGIAIMSEIVPKREATWTLILYEPSGKQYKSLIAECKEIVHLMMDKYKLERMVTHTSHLNKPAQMIASHIGFHRDGVGRSELHINGEYQDCVHYSILKNEVNNNGQAKSKMGGRDSHQRTGQGAAKPRELPGAVRNADAGNVPRSDQRRDEPVPEHGGKHAVGDVRVRGWTGTGWWQS